MSNFNNADNVTERVPLLRTAESDEIVKFRLQLESNERMFDSLPQADKSKFLERIWFGDKDHKGKFQRILPL